MIDLSVLICSTHTRWDTFGQAIQAQIWGQVAALPDPARVEVLMLSDNKQQMLGHKRNLLVDMAQGRYVAFVDDDDRLEPDYLTALLEATESGADVLTFLVSVSLNGAAPKICRYSKDFAADRNLDSGYERLPNHLCAVKRDLARTVSFPLVPYGEDAGYSKLLHRHLVTEHAIDRVLYHYDFDTATTETQQHLRNQSRPRTGDPLVDAVILSKADTAALAQSTQRTIDTLLSGANGLPVSVTVLEQARNVCHQRATTIYAPETFNYNQFANRGARLGSAEWILIANNDLTFHDGWLHHLIAAEWPLVSPKCPGDERQADIVNNTAGPITGRHLSGWCFLISRRLWERIGGFDEDFAFWCADDSLIEQCLRVKVQPMLVPAAVVDHDRSQTFPGHGDGRLTWAQLNRFITKYGPHRLQNHPDFLAWKSAND